MGELLIFPYSLDHITHFLLVLSTPRYIHMSSSPFSSRGEPEAQGRKSAYSPKVLSPEASEKPVLVSSFSALTPRLRKQARESFQELHRCWGIVETEAS